MEVFQLGGDVSAWQRCFSFEEVFQLRGDIFGLVEVFQLGEEVFALGLGVPA